MHGIRHLFGWLERLTGLIPVLGPVVSAGVGALSWVVGTIVSLLVIGAAYIVLRPWLGVTIVGGIVAAIVVASVLYRRAHRVVPPPLPSGC